MKIHQQAVFGPHFRRTAVESDHHLIVPVHEIDLKAFDPHLGIVAADILHVAVECPVTRPENDADMAFRCVCDDTRQVYFRNHLHQVRPFVHSPAFVQNDVFDTVFGCEINVVFIGFRVYSRRKVHTIEIPCIPPVPCHLAGFHPTEITRRGRGYFIDHVAVQKLGVVLGNDHDPPRETGRIRRPGPYSPRAP